ncbi:hypothetical protein MH171_003526 [Vibrio parahaemolyticus]|nr:hypothetical protein [Vibrio parahaemolyticus]EHR1002448.1 hypothetical protein [Vibrio parahaemolyticus]EHU4958658.1 hypothetical protein [Vibrio parahaemolyticus]EIU6861913.1 hypothetical protein [Vibrio parahaemolyticus]EIU7062468.1 hypothetical protein [Vibrio parahaemolyticus]EIW7863552.1 hypothetical protein [Vibrio parahaemolyticus]
MSYGKLIGAAVSVIAAGVTGYILGGEKHKNQEERSDFKSGHNRGRAESASDLKAANDTIERVMKANKKYVNHQNRIIALITVGSAAAACKTPVIPPSSFNELVQAAGGIAIDQMTRETENAVNPFMESPPSMQDAIKVAKAVSLTEEECLEMIEIGMTVDGEPNDKQHAFFNTWIVEVGKAA